MEEPEDMMDPRLLVEKEPLLSASLLTRESFRLPDLLLVSELKSVNSAVEFSHGTSSSTTDIIRPLPTADLRAEDFLRILLFGCGVLVNYSLCYILEATYLVELMEVLGASHSGS